MSIKPRKREKKPSGTTQPAAPDGAESITVRMYRRILGDCFLLTHQYQGRTFRALIDCGVLQCIGTAEAKPGTKAGIANLGTAIADLAAHCGGKLDLIIATHEHYDHLSGFMLHNAVFDSFDIAAVWLAWTEDDNDDLAVAIKQKRSKGLETLAALVAPAGPGAPALAPLQADGTVDDRVQRIRDLLQFYGDLPPRAPTSGTALAAAPATPRTPVLPPRSCADVFHFFKTKVGRGVSYLSPGQRIAFGIDGRLAANVLGPPRTRDRLLQLDPTKADGNGKVSEVYLAGPNALPAAPESAAHSIYLTHEDDVAALNATLACQQDVPGVAPTLPFAARFNRWLADGEGDDLARAYYHPADAARRIDGEWLGSAETLAMKIDGDVNNTSLALAIELPSEDVLLFPADAQVGNWLSWQDQNYPDKPDPAVQPPVRVKTANELLSRVIFYKVGHHGSHNATIRALGLEQMTSPNLVAMVPVVKQVAAEQKTRTNPDGWAMPYDPLFARLIEKTGNRIVCGDGDPAAEAKAFAAPGSRFALRYGDDTADPIWAEVQHIID